MSYYADIDRTRSLDRVGADDPQDSPDAWVLARGEFECGESVAATAERLGLKRSTIYKRARSEGWRRRSEPAFPPFDPAAPAPVLDDLARDAFARLGHAIHTGNAAQVGLWLRAHERLSVLAQTASLTALAPECGAVATTRGEDLLEKVSRHMLEIERIAMDVPLAKTREEKAAIEARVTAIEEAGDRLFGPDPKATTDAGLLSSDATPDSAGHL